MKNEVPGFENAHIVEIAPQVGIRETRRIGGLYSLSGNDIVGCADFDDAIGVNAWPMELHVAGKIEWGFFPEDSRGFCQLPFRMLIPNGVSNLLVAGRCASMTAGNCESASLALHGFNRWRRSRDDTIP